MKFNFIVFIVLFSFNAMASLSCQQIITRGGEVLIPEPSSLSKNFYDRVDGSQMGLQIVESNEFRSFNNVDTSSKNCLVEVNNMNYSRLVFEEKMLIGYIKSQQHVDYVIVIPHNGIDDVIFYRGNIQDFNRREDGRIFEKKSTFPDIKEIKDAIIEKSFSQK